MNTLLNGIDKEKEVGKSVLLKSTPLNGNSIIDMTVSQPSPNPPSALF